MADNKKGAWNAEDIKKVCFYDAGDEVMLTLSESTSEEIDLYRQIIKAVRKEMNETKETEVGKDG